MVDDLDLAASAAGTFTRASFRALLVTAVPVAAISLTMGYVIFLADNMLVKGSGR